MRSLLLAAAAVCGLAYPAAPARAEQPVPTMTAPVTLVAPAVAPAGVTSGSAGAPSGGLTKLTVKDGDGTLRTLLCRPISEEKAAPIPPRTVSKTVVRAPGALPYSPAPASSMVPAARRGDAPAACPPPPRPTDRNIVPGAPLYAAPAAVAAAWNCYAPRQMAYAPRERRAPDPAVHSPLPPLRSPARWSGRPRAAAKPAVQIGIDVLVSTVQALCPPVSSSRATVSPVALPAPGAGTEPGAVQAGAAAASRDIYGGPAPSVR